MVLAFIAGLLCGWLARRPQSGLWRWSRQPRASEPPAMEEIAPALQMLDFAAARLSMHMWSGYQVAKAIEYAERHIAYAKRHIDIVDPDDPAVDEPDFML